MLSLQTIKKMNPEVKTYVPWMAYDHFLKKK